ncbi:hypothetical protein C7460_11341 [Marinoscillum furvescens DSM 4134]|uniref:Uncharacterized protein n=1 Tax=Marinoscillum furvescens DSM 4134 TaxID=1122208 RepID=A0A3D9L0L4_MARFU|nr:hypothetical protein C7460_11341 [Marinoscillum furvescens DSM 4134]
MRCVEVLPQAFLRKNPSPTAIFGLMLFICSQNSCGESGLGRAHGKWRTASGCHDLFLFMEAVSDSANCFGLIHCFPLEYIPACYIVCEQACSRYSLSIHCISSRSLICSVKVLPQAFLWKNPSPTAIFGLMLFICSQNSCGESGLGRAHGKWRTASGCHDLFLFIGVRILLCAILRFLLEC